MALVEKGRIGRIEHELRVVATTVPQLTVGRYGIHNSAQPQPLQHRVPVCRGEFHRSHRSQGDWRNRRYRLKDFGFGGGHRRWGRGGSRGSGRRLRRRGRPFRLFCRCVDLPRDGLCSAGTGRGQVAGGQVVIYHRGGPERHHAQQRHLKAATGVTRQGNIPLAIERYLVKELNILGCHRRRQLCDPFGIAPTIVDGRRHHLGDCHPVQQGNQLIQTALEIRRVFRHVGHHSQQPRRVARRQGFQQPVDEAQLHAAQHTADVVLVEFARAKGDGLVGQAQGVSHTARGRPAQQPQGGLLETDHLLSQHMAQVSDDLLGRHVFQVELQAAGQNSDRQFLRVGGGQQEFNVRRRLFQGFEQGIEAVPRQHVDLVDQVHLVAGPGRCVLDIFQQVAGVLHLGARGRVHFQQVDTAALGNLQAGRALAAGLGTDPGFTVETLGQNAGDGGLAHTAGTGEQVGVVQAIVVQGVDQRLQYMLLADHLAKALGSPLAREYLVGHAVICLGSEKRELGYTSREVRQNGHTTGQWMRMRYRHRHSCFILSNRITFDEISALYLRHLLTILFFPLAYRSIQAPVFMLARMMAGWRQ